jgi:hypothetical protein
MSMFTVKLKSEILTTIVVRHEWGGGGIPSPLMHYDHDVCSLRVRLPKMNN